MKNIIIGDLGSGAYVFFRYLIWKETTSKFIVIDDVHNKEFIKLLNKRNSKSLFYDFKKEEFKGISFNDIKGNKVYINAPNKFQLQYDWLLDENNGVLRVAINDLRIELMNNINKFNSIVIFNPCNENKKNWLANIFSLYSNEILKFSANRKDEYIVINKGEIKHLSLELDENFPLSL